MGGAVVGEGNLAGEGGGGEAFLKDGSADVGEGYLWGE